MLRLRSWAAALVVLAAILGALLSSAPQQSITVEGGTKGGLFDVMLNLLADDLAPHGITVNIVNRPDSLKIVDDIADPDGPVEAGFIASDVPLDDYDSVSQLGTVMLSPVYLITHLESEVQDIYGFKGRTISLYPVGSAAWAVCDYVLGSFGINITEANSQYGGGPTIVKNVADRVTEVGCFVDVPSGSSLKYATTILNELANPELRLIAIPQARAIQARKNFLRPLTIPAGAFSVNPPRPSSDIDSASASLTFVAKRTLPREIAIMVGRSLLKTYRGSTIANQVGELPALNLVDLPVHDSMGSIYEQRPPWMYRAFPSSFATAAFIDKFLSRYGLVLTVLITVLSLFKLLGVKETYHWVVSAQLRRWRRTLEHVDAQLQLEQGLSPRDARRLARIERWFQPDLGINELKDQLREIRNKSGRGGAASTNADA